MQFVGCFVSISMESESLIATAADLPLALLIRCWSMQGAVLARSLVFESGLFGFFFSWHSVFFHNNSADTVFFLTTIQPEQCFGLFFQPNEQGR